MDAREIIRKRDKIRDLLGTFHQRCTDVLVYYDLEKLANVPGDLKSYVPPTARHVPDTLSSALHPTAINVTVPPRVSEPHSGWKNAEEQSKKLGPAHKDWLARANVARGSSLILENIKSMLLFGIAINKGPYLNPTIWGDPPERQKRQKREDYDLLMEQWENQRKTLFPIDIWPVNPLNIYPDPGLFTGNEPQYVIESYERLAGEVKLRYNLSLEVDDFEKIQWTEYHYKGGRIYLVGNEIVVAKSKEEGTYNYPYLPYNFAFAGLGLATGKPEDKAMGIIWQILSSLGAQIRAATSADILAQYYGLTVFRQLAEFNPNIVKLYPGAMNPQEVQIEPLFEVKPGMMDPILQLYALTTEDIEDATYSRILAAAAGGRMTATEHSTRALLAFQRYVPLLLSLKAMWSKISSNIAWIVENELKFPLNEHIKPKEIQGYYICEVEFEVLENLKKQAKIDEMNQLALFYSRKTLRETFHPIEEAVDEEERILEEAVVYSPDTVGALAGESFAVADKKEQLAEVQGGQGDRLREDSRQGIR